MLTILNQLDSVIKSVVKYLWEYQRIVEQSFKKNQRDIEDIIDIKSNSCSIKRKFKTVFGEFDYAVYENKRLKYLIKIEKNEERRKEEMFLSLIDAVSTLDKVTGVVVVKNKKRLNSYLKRQKYSKNIYYSRLIFITPEKIKEIL